MKQEILSTANRPTIEDVKEQFKNWRATKQRRTRIPEYLWQAAIDLSRDYTVGTVAKILSLGYSDLKQRVKAADMPTDNQDMTSHFVEFNLNSEKTGESIVEIENKNGSRMKIQLKGCHGNNIFGLTKAFWDAGQ